MSTYRWPPVEYPALERLFRSIQEPQYEDLEKVFNLHPSNADRDFYDFIRDIDKQLCSE